MSDLHGFDGIFQISENFMVKLATVIENKFADLIEDGDASCPDVDIVDRTIEAVANRLLLIPRLMYATRNPDYAVPSGATLQQRLDAHRALGDLDEPLGFGSQPNRLVFLRDTFFTLENPPTITFETDRIRIPIKGTAFLGRRFRTRADSSPGGALRSGPFSLDLVYRVEVIDQPDKGLSFQRFYSVVSNLGARTAGDPTLPQCQMQVYTLNEGTRRNPEWILPPVDTASEDLRRASFNDSVGAEIFETPAALGAGNARFQVQEREVTTPGTIGSTLRLFLVDVDGAVSNHGGTQCVGQPFADVVATPLQGRISLVFDHLENLKIDITGENFASSVAVIQESLVRENPFGVSLFSLSGSIPSDLFAQLEVQGLHGLDSPIFPKVFPLSFDAEILPGDTFVTSSAQQISFTNTKVIANDALVLAGTLTGTGGDISAVPSLLNLSGGGRADTSTALSRRFFYDVFLDKLEEAINQKLLEKPEINAVANIDAIFEDGQIVVKANGSGTAEDAVLWFDVDFDFNMRFPIRLQLQNAIARETFEREVTGEDGTTSTQKVRLPVDAWGEAIPEWVFLPASDGGLGIGPALFETSDPNINPVCFLGFCDPDKLTPPQLFCPDAIPSNAPIRYNDDGTERPPDAEEDRNQECHRQRDFTDFPTLTHAQEIGFIWPTEDEVTFDTDLDLGFLGFLIVGLIVLLVGAITFGGGLLLGAAAITAALIGLGVAFSVGLVSGLVIESAVEAEAETRVGDKVSDKVADALASITLTLNPSFDLRIGLASYVVDTSIQGDSNINFGALINRSRTVVETQDDTTGLEGFLDEC